MVTNSIKATGYMYLSSNTGTQVQNKNQTDFANVMEKAGEAKQNETNKNNSVQNTSSASKTDSKTETDQKLSKEEPKSDKTLSSQTKETQNTETSETQKPEDEKMSADMEKPVDDSMDAEDFTKAAENLVNFQLMDNTAEQVPDDVVNELLNNLSNDFAKDEPLNNVTKQVFDNVAEKLQVSIEDIQTSMKNLNMTVSDLEEPQNLLKLIVDVKELKGPEELLTIPQLADTLKDLKTNLKDIFNEQTEETSEYKPVMKQEEVSVDAKISLAMEENSRENSGGEDKHSDFAGKSSHMQMFQNSNVNSTFFVQQADGIQDKIQELMAERVDAETSENIVKQVIEQVKLNIKTDVTSVQMQLYPEHLGKVAIQVVSKNGVLTAQIAAENEGAKAALESQLSALKESFDNQGLKVESVEVMVSSRGFDQNADTNEDASNNQKQGKRVRRNLLDELEGADEDLQEEEDLKTTLGNTVSYTA